MKWVIILTVALLAGCSTTPVQYPCAGLDASSYYQCAAYQEQVRANQMNFFFQQQQQWNQNAYRPKQTTQTDCIADGFGGMSCQSR